MYQNSTCSVKINDHQTPSFSYCKGVRQGWVLSPLVLFNIYINELPVSLEQVKVNPFILPDGTKLSTLLYADD